MRNEEELKQIALEWAHETLECWQDEYGAWDDKVEYLNLTDEELEFCQNVKFNIELTQ